MRLVEWQRPKVGSVWAEEVAWQGPQLGLLNLTGAEDSCAARVVARGIRAKNRANHEARGSSRGLNLT